MGLKIAILLALSWLLCSCNVQTRERAQQTIDSLRIELQENQKLTKTILDIGKLIDSIDVNRKALHLQMIEGTNYKNYVSRMHNINQYVIVAEKRIGALERASRHRNDAALMSAIGKLKGNLNVRNQELAALKDQVATYKSDNENLVRTVSLQKAELADKSNQIKSKQADVLNLQGQVNKLLVKSSLDQGEDFFARASAIEEAANRTHFAPHKRKTTLNEAMRLYKLAVAFGKEDAQAKITTLEKRI